MLSNIKPVKTDKILMEMRDKSVYLSGTVLVEQPAKFMEPFFIDVHEAILDEGISEIKIDLRDLKFLNSSGIKEIVKWILKVDALPDETQYSLMFLYNPETLWQESFISSIVNLNPEIIKKVTI